MKSNFLIITIDALSKWYIDQYKEKDGFFSRLEKECFCMENLFSTGPFTEAAVRGFWTGCDSLKGIGYMSESCFEGKTIFEYFTQKQYYMYYGKLPPFFHYKIKCDNKIKREKCEERAFAHIWKNRIKFYIGLHINNNEYWKIEFILDDFFEKYSVSEKVMQEKEKYIFNKKEYIEDIFYKKEESSFYKELSSDLFFSCLNKNITSYKNQKRHELLSEEAIFIKKAKNKNNDFLLEANSEFLELVEKEMNGTSNRCINSNNDLLSHMRDEYEILPKLKEEIDDFLMWYDEEGNELREPFFAYIHNYDFHYPENFLNSRYESKESYVSEIQQLNEYINEMEYKKMSVSKQLCLRNIERNLEYLWRELEKRNFFENTCVVITADHGISNFLYTINPSENRWNYTKTNFNVPFYLRYSGINSVKNTSLSDTKVIKKVIEKVSQSDEVLLNIDEVIGNEEFIFTAWINGVPDIERNPIKIGIRNKNYSITCQGFFTQVFASLKIMGIYDIEQDTDEINSLKYAYIKKREFENLYNIMKDKWLELIISIITKSDCRYNLLQKYNYILDDIDTYKKWNNLTKISKKEMFDKVMDKRVIIFGRGQRAKDFISKYGYICSIEEIWDNNNTDGSKYYCGHRLSKPHKKEMKNIVVVICSRYEIDIIYQIETMGIYNYILYDTLDEELWEV